MRCSQPYQKTDRLGYAREYPCGRCLNCRINRAEEWSTRIILELEKNPHGGDFVTLTFDDKKACPLLPQALSKRILQNFMKRLRKGGHKIKYFACGEYGEKHHRAHYHAVIIRGEDQPDYSKFWKLGDVNVGTVTRASARYCTGYLTKSNTIPPGRGAWPPFQLQSQGIGREWAIANRYDIAKELTWIPRYIATKANHKHTPDGTNPPSRHFTPAAQLSQRRWNAEAKRNSQES